MNGDLWHAGKGSIVKRIAMLIAALLQFGVAAPVLAAPLCLTQTLSDYLALGATGCTVGGVTLSDFIEVTPVSPGATQIASSAVTLTPVSGSGGVGLALSSGQSIDATAGEILELWFGFRATDAGGLTGNTIVLGTPTVSGDGAITIVEDKCLDGSFSSPSAGCSGTPLTQIVFAIDGDSDLEETATFAPASFFDVFVDLVIDGGVEGSAGLGPQLGELRIAADGASVTEPPALAVLALALLAMAGLQRRKPRHV